MFGDFEMQVFMVILLSQVKKLLPLKKYSISNLILPDIGLRNPKLHIGLSVSTDLECFEFVGKFVVRATENYLPNVSHLTIKLND